MNIKSFPHDGNSFTGSVGQPPPLNTSDQTNHDDNYEPAPSNASSHSNLLSEAYIYIVVRQWKKCLMIF